MHSLRYRYLYCMLMVGHDMGNSTPTCKGTVGSEAGDLPEPVVRLKSHKLTTI